MKNTNERIKQQEKKDRYVAEKCLKKILSAGTNLQMSGTELTCSVDIKGEVTNKNNKRVAFSCEIKERNKSPEQLQKWPNAELKVEKLNRMKKDKRGILLYMVLLNEKECLLFNLSKINWATIPLRIWNIKKTQFNPNSPVVPTPTYFIPYDLAIKRIDCTEFYN